MPILKLKAHQSAMRRILRAIRDSLFRLGRTSANKAHPGVERPDACGAKTEMWRMQTTRYRLAAAVARLERLDVERERWGDSRFGKTAENIIWGELIELELQEIDEQVSRICNSAGRSVQAATQSNLRPRGSYERDA
jgi:hypothetical protein